MTKIPAPQSRDDGSQSTAIEVRLPPEVLPAAPPFRGAAIVRPSEGDFDDTTQRSPGTLALYLHAFRRHWPLAITLGLACGLVASVSAWLLTTDKYTAVSLLQISAVQQAIVFQTDDRSQNSFEIFKGTQQQLLTSDVVLISALRKSEAARSPVIQKEADPVRWLANNLRVEYPGNAEIMRVTLTGTNPDEVALLVRAVVEAYMNGAGDADRREKRDRLAELDKLYNEKSNLLRSKRMEMKQLEETLKTSDPGTLSLKQQMAMQEYVEARSEWVRVHTELQRAKEDLQLKTQWCERIKQMQSAPQAVVAGQEFPVDRDPQIAKLLDQIDQCDYNLSKVVRNLTEKYQREKARLQKIVAERRQALAAARIGKSGSGDMAPDLAELQTRIDNLTAQEKAASADRDAKRETAEKFGNSSIDVEMMRSELMELDSILKPIAEKRDKLSVELSSMPRISVFQSAEAPKSPDAKARVMNTGLAGGGSFFAVVFLLLWWDVRKQRINSMADLSSGMGLCVVGAVPLLPQLALAPRVRRAHKHQRRWQASLNHAVDGIVARLFLRKNGDEVRVALVTSAAQGEGKTMLAVNLAKRLARTGARTLLVDFDLRRPSIHRIFGMIREGGVGECLAGASDPLQVARPTDTENLSIITAGSSLADPLGPLANGVTSSFFEKARAEYKFVIVDGSPILPVIDGLLTSQYADTVIMSVRRDTSQAPKVLRACEKLSAFAGGKFVVVLNGSEEDSYGPYQEHLLQVCAKAAGASEPVPTEEVANV